MCVSVTAVAAPEDVSPLSPAGEDVKEDVENVWCSVAANRSMACNRTTNEERALFGMWRTVTTCFAVTVLSADKVWGVGYFTTGLCGLHRISARMVGPDGVSATMPGVDPITVFIVGGHGVENKYRADAGTGTSVRQHNFPCLPRDRNWKGREGGRSRDTSNIFDVPPGPVALKAMTARELRDTCDKWGTDKVRHIHTPACFPRGDRVSSLVVRRPSGGHMRGCVNG